MRILKVISVIFKPSIKLPVLEEHVLIIIPDESFHMEKKPMQYYEKENHLINKYTCHNKQLKMVFKSLPSTFMKLRILTFFSLFSIFELNIRVFDEVYAYFTLQSAVVFSS